MISLFLMDVDRGLNPVRGARMSVAQSLPKRNWGQNTWREYDRLPGNQMVFVHSLLDRNSQASGRGRDTR
jgi:hypothetical protein